MIVSPGLARRRSDRPTQRHRAAARRSLRHVPSRRRLGAVQPADLRRRRGARRRSRRSRGAASCRRGRRIRRTGRSSVSTAERRRDRDDLGDGSTSGAAEGDAARVCRRRATLDRRAGNWARRISSSRCREPYTLPAEGTDVFRIFVLPMPVATARVRARPRVPARAMPKVVHHANIRIDPTPASRASRRGRSRRPATTA